MKIFSVLLLCLYITITFSARLDFNSADCNKYLGKFGTANNADGSGASKIAFSGDAAFVGTSSDVKVNLRYSDVDLYNDATFWGLVQEDGKTPETTCLDLKLYKFPASDYSNGVQVTDLTITPSKNFQKQWRYYSFTIKGADLATRLIQTANSNNYVYKGYYGIAFYAAGTDQLQYTFFFFYFDFSVTVNRSTGAAVDTAFKPLSLTASAGCTPGGACTVTAQSQLQWCTDFTCTAFSTPDLHLNDQFVLLQKITTDGMANFYLTGTEVWYTGNGLNKKATITQIDNATKGQVKLLLKAEIAWRAVTIKVNSVLSNTQTGARRLLAQTTFDTVSAQSNEIECIKAEGAQTCPTCDQQCAANGFAGDTCSVCTRSFKFHIILYYIKLFCYPAHFGDLNINNINKIGPKNIYIYKINLHFLWLDT